MVEADHERALLLKVEKQLVALSKAGGGEGDEGGEGKAVGDGEAAGEGVLAAAAVVTYRGEEISLTEVYEKLESIDARTAETRAHKILSGTSQAAVAVSSSSSSSSCSSSSQPYTNAVYTHQHTRLYHSLTSYLFHTHYTSYDPIPRLILHPAFHPQVCSFRMK